MKCKSPSTYYAMLCYFTRVPCERKIKLNSSWIKFYSSWIKSIPLVIFLANCHFFSLRHFSHLSCNSIKTRRNRIWIAYLFGHYDRIDLIFLGYFKKLGLWPKKKTDLPKLILSHQTRAFLLRKFLSSCELPVAGSIPLSARFFFYEWISCGLHAFLRLCNYGQ